MSNEKNTELNDRKSEISPVIEYQSEKELNFLFNENRELRDINMKLCEKKEEFERKIKNLNIKIDDDESFNVKEIIYIKEIQIEELKEKFRTLEKEVSLSNGKIEILEGVINSELKFEDVFRTLDEKEILKYFNDMVSKNVDKRDELRRQNKILLEKFILLGKEYNKLK